MYNVGKLQNGAVVSDPMGPMGPTAVHRVSRKPKAKRGRQTTRTTSPRQHGQQKTSHYRRIPECDGTKQRGGREKMTRAPQQTPGGWRRRGAQIESRPRGPHKVCHLCGLGTSDWSYRGQAPVVLARIRQRGEGKVLGKDCKAGVFQIGMRSRHRAVVTDTMVL